MKIFAGSCLMLISSILYAQTGQKINEHIGEVEVDILSSYYEQDGDHGAVLGGAGSQMLTDKTAGIQVNVPIDTVNIINLAMNWDLYTSASTNQIDVAVTGASSRTYRSYGNLNYSRNLKHGNAISIGGGFSNEYDVKSKSVYLGLSHESPSRNTSFDFHGKAYLDNWLMIYPTELRYNSDTFGFPNQRKTTSASLSVSQIINRKLQALVTYEVIMQNGLLSTPFHRVYFNDSDDIIMRAVRPEKLPESRIKHAIASRWSWYPFNQLIVRAFYRYYFDSFKMSAHTASIELPVKITRFFSVYPFYRYYTQTGYNYFKPFGEHSLDQEYYTSDYDLSDFYSQKYGLGIRYSPPLGIVSFSNKLLFNRTNAFKSIEFRYGQYHRSDGLKAYFASANLTFTL